MIKITFYKNKKNEYIGFQLKGHAGFAEYGQDIVCAAVSALSINTVNSIESLTNDKIEVKTDEELGLLSLKFLSPVSLGAKILIDSLSLGIKGIIEDNNTEYISVTFEEV